MTFKDDEIRKWGVDLTICLNRFKAFNAAADEWSRTGGGKQHGLIFNFLDLKGNDAIKLPPHPYIEYTDEEKSVFDQCFGKPLEVPKRLLLNVSLRDFIKQVDERKILFEECLAYTPQSRFRNFQSTNKKNVSKAPPKKKTKYKKAPNKRPHKNKRG
jgi:hypothetical protein